MDESKKTYPSVTVMMMTAVEERAVMEKAIALGARKYVLKPFNLNDLERTVADLIEELLSSRSNALNNS